MPRILYHIRKYYRNYRRWMWPTSRKHAPLQFCYPRSFNGHYIICDLFTGSSGSSKMCDAVLDLWPDSKPQRTLYQRTRSMPYLRYEDKRNSTQANSVNSVDASDGNFPLSLFPTPPVLIVKKRIPPLSCCVIHRHLLFKAPAILRGRDTYDPSVLVSAFSIQIEFWFIQQT